MQQMTLLTAVAGIALSVPLAGCSRQPRTGSQFWAQWEYVRILKDDKGQVKEAGDKHSQDAMGREVVLFKEGGLDVVEVGPTKVKFRISSKEGGNQEVEVEPGGSKDVWFEGGRSGIRIRVEKMALAVLVEVLAPIALAVWLARRFHGRWRFWLVGVLVFLLSQGLTRVPAMLYFQTRPAVVEALKEPLWFWLFLLFAAFTAGLFEEGGRWIAFRWFVPPAERHWRTALMLGAGHGGLESVGIGLLALAGLVSYLVLALLPAESLGVPAAQVEAARKQFTSLQGWEPLLGAWERLGALAVQVAFTVLVLQAFLRGRRWWWYALAAHTLVDFTTVGLLRLAGSAWGQRPGLLLTEGLVAFYAALAVWLIAALRGGCRRRSGHGGTRRRQPNRRDNQARCHSQTTRTGHGLILGETKTTRQASDGARSPIDAHPGGNRCLSRPGGPGLGRAGGLLLSPGPYRAGGGAGRAGWRGAPCRRQSEQRGARGSWQPLGHRRLCPDRAAGRVLAGLHRPQGVLDHRRRYRSLAWRRALRSWWVVRSGSGRSLCSASASAA
jgi:uncharacterized membrane protein YhfC